MNGRDFKRLCIAAKAIARRYGAAVTKGEIHGRDPQHEGVTREDLDFLKRDLPAVLEGSDAEREAVMAMFFRARQKRESIEFQFSKELASTLHLAAADRKLAAQLAARAGSSMARVGTTSPSRSSPSIPSTPPPSTPASPSRSSTPASPSRSSTPVHYPHARRRERGHRLDLYVTGDDRAAFEALHAVLVRQNPKLTPSRLVVAALNALAAAYVREPARVLAFLSQVPPHPDTIKAV